MRSFLSSIIPSIILCSFFISCNSNSIAGKPTVKPECRLLDSTELKKYHDSLELFFNSLLLNQGFSGGILVAKNGQILYERYQGFVDAGKADSIKEFTPFHVASTSKTFTSTAIMQLVEAGKLNLDDSLGKFFPLFPYEGVTVRNLLSHSSGIPYYVNLFAKYKWDRDRIATNEDVLQMLYANRPPLDFTTGSRFKYCNTNFVLLALVVEEVTGQLFPSYVKDSIFTKCGMTNSYIVSQNNPEDFLPSWSPGSRIYHFDSFDGIYGDKNVFTTCRDLLKYDSCIREHILLAPSSYEQVWTPSFRDNHYHDSIEHYGLGWRLKVFSDSLKIAYHNGWWHGNNSVFQRVIADTAVIIVTGNRFSSRIYQAAKAANIFRPYYTSGEMPEELGSDDQATILPQKGKSSVSSSSRSSKRTKAAAPRKRKR